MPHFTLEYSRGVERLFDLEAVMASLYEVGATSGVMKPDDIKIRALAYDTYRFEGGIESFLHLTVWMLEGRSDRQKEHLAVRLRDRLDEQCPSVDSISIDVRDMNPVAYKKRLLDVRGR